MFPMNACTAGKKIVDLMNDDNYIAQEKIDGVRGLIEISLDGKVNITTRGESVDNPGVAIDITHRIYMVHEWYVPSGLFGCTLDCEITIDGYNSAEVAGFLSYKSIKPIPKGMKFNCFDMIKLGGEELFEVPQLNRIKYLRNFSELFPEWLVYVPYAEGTQEKQDLLDSLWAVGKEGIMLKNINAKYSPDKRYANVWYKHKKFDTIDARITGALPPEMYYYDTDTNTFDESRRNRHSERGWLGSIEFLCDDGTTGSVIGFNDETRAMFSNGCNGIKPEYIGRYMELKYMEKTKDGFLRHPTFIRLREEIEKK